MLLRHAEVDGRLQTDLRVSHGMVTEVAPALRRCGDEPTFDCQGGAVLPGLCDHHVHLHALAARAGSAECGPPAVTGPAALAGALAAARPDSSGWIRAARTAGRAVAVHCVTREALVLLLAVLAETGARPGDRIEHAALVPPELVPELARLGVRVVTQPGFLAHRGDDFLRDVPPADRPDLYRCATLLRAGIPVALSSDAPFGPLDPWAVIAAAVGRRTASGEVASPGERISFAQALDAYLAPPEDPGGPPRRVSPGLPADLVVLRAPLAQAARLPDPVRAVLVNGTIATDKELSG